ncbi:hypothetical protein ACRRTK_021651 [Alexandromys fortis]
MSEWQSCNPNLLLRLGSPYFLMFQWFSPMGWGHSFPPYFIQVKPGVRGKTKQRLFMSLQHRNTVPQMHTLDPGGSMDPARAPRNWQQ